MKKTVLFCLLTASVITAKSQITPSITIPNPIPEYDGTYENFGQNHLYYPNAGEIRFEDEAQSNAIDEVKYYTMNTHPKKYLLNNNNMSFVYGRPDNSPGATPATMDSLHRIDIEWDRSKNSAFLAEVDTQNFGKLNYFTQWFDSLGRTDVRGRASIVCQSIYQNIDLVYTSNNAGAVIYFIVYPGGDYNDIYLRVNGSKANYLTSGKLKFESNWDSNSFLEPQMYQYTIVSNVVTPVTVCNPSWQSVGGGLYKIQNSDPYNTALPLIIQIKEDNAVVIDEPGLCWSTYFGGNQFEFMTKTHTDASDNLYIAGNSNSTGNTFPQAQGVAKINAQSTDGAITKFNSAGQIQWSTFIGGSANEDIRDFDIFNNVITCVGRTSSSNLLTQQKTGSHIDATLGGGNGVWDGFIFEFDFNPTTQLIQKKWLTYFGGNHEDDIYGCRIDASGNLYIVGASASSDMGIYSLTGGYNQNFNTAQLNSSFPLSTDAIIGKFNSTGAIQWFTFFGTTSLGTNAHNHAGDYFYGIALAGNNVYACGKAGGTNLPSAVNSKFVSGQFDGILANFTTNGALTASKFTDGNIVNYAVKEIWGEVFTVGEANSSMTPANSGFWYYNNTASGTSDACFSIHTTNLSATTTHNTFLGGNDDDGAYDLAFTTNNLLVISGGTKSSNFPVTSLGSMYNASFAGGINDNFISCFQKNNANILWSSCLGSNFNESMNMPPYINSAFDLANTTISIDSQNKLRLLGSTTSYNTFPLDDGAGVPYFQPTAGGFANDASITCFDMADINTITGLKDFKNTEFVFGLYPNPTSKNLSITNTALVNDNLKYAIYDVTGKKLQAGNLKASDTKNIDVSSLQQGVYIINVSNGKMTYSNKFVKVVD